MERDERTKMRRRENEEERKEPEGGRGSHEDKKME